MTEDYQKAIRAMAITMLEEKVENTLEVILIPAPVQKHMGHCIRVACKSNPEWYQEMFASYLPKKMDHRLVMKSLYNIAKWQHNIDRQYDSMVYSAIVERLLTENNVHALNVEEHGIPF